MLMELSAHVRGQNLANNHRVCGAWLVFLSPAWLARNGPQQHWSAAGDDEAKPEAGARCSSLMKLILISMPLATCLIDRLLIQNAI
jgi:hypothetical protein